jgi:DNA-binding CsgD family transcriptional regulator/PAS domain-containing protein
MPPTERALFKLTGSLYDAAADPAHWESFLEQLASVLGAHSADILMYQAGAGNVSYSVSRAWHVDPEAVRLYEAHYGPLDIWAVRGRLQPSGRVLTSESLCSRTEYRASEIYNDLLSRYDIEYGMFSLVENSQDRLAVVNLFRDASEPFQASDIEVLELLTPHIQSAFKLHFQFSELKAQAAGFSAALDMMATGVVVLGAKGKILLMNRAANAIVAQDDGLLATGRGLRAERAAESAQLGRLICEAVRTAEGKGLSAGGGLSISRRKRAALQVLICPVQSIQIEVTRPLRAIVFITDPEQRAHTTHDILHALFGLTPAECRVALLLGDGKTPREISQLLALSTNTVKSQVAIIYAKTGTARHAQLVRLLARLPCSPVSH